MLNNPITLITAVPGAGKTLRSIYEGIELAKDGRKVFFYGVDGINCDKIKELFDVDTYKLDDDWTLEKWKQLPEKSVLIVDEAHKFLPVRQPGKPPQWIQDLTEIRHFGIQLILITQDPRNIDAFVRRLVGEHLHLSRKAGFAGAMVRTFQGCVENTDDYTQRQSSTQSPWLYDKKLYDVYKSASLHVIKPKLPKKMVFAFSALIFLIFLIPFLIYKFKDTMFGEKEPEVKEGVSTPKNVFKSNNEKEVFYEAEEYLKAHTPIIPLAPWSAPIFQEKLEVKTNPRVFCVIFGNQSDKDYRCNCYTEQMTKLKNIPLPICEQAVREGIYNPYKEPFENNNYITPPRENVQSPGGNNILIPKPEETILKE